MTYLPKKFAGGIIRIREPKPTTLLIFASGKMVCTGAKSEQEALDATKLYAKRIRKVSGILISRETEDLEFKIQNIVGSHYVGF
jgi:transcription initiation factor TFIID TATA-box-binding protein